MPFSLCLNRKNYNRDINLTLTYSPTFLCIIDWNVFELR